MSGPRIVTPLPGPNARRIVAEDSRYMSPSYTRCYPLVVRRARGAIVEDVDGNEFLDFSAGIAVTSTGHCHPEVVAAIQKQAAELIHMSGTDFYYEQMPALAARLSRIAPMPGPHKFFFGNSGAEAVECCMKLARYHTRRQHIIAFLGAFHGRTMGALSLTASRPQQRRRFAPLVPGVTHAPYPKTEVDAPRCARFIEETLFRSMLPPEEVAAIVIEPIQGEGGYIVAPSVFLQEIRRICDRHGILMVVDEVQSGAGRTGKWWAIEHAGVQPDIVASAKGNRLGNAARNLHGEGRNHGLGARIAWLYLRRKSGVNRGRAGHHDHPRTRSDRECRGRGRSHEATDECVAGTISSRPRDSRPRADDRCRGLRTTATQSSTGPLSEACSASARVTNAIRLTPPLIVSKEQADIAMNVFEDCLG